MSPAAQQKMLQWDQKTVLRPSPAGDFHERHKTTENQRQFPVCPRPQPIPPLGWSSPFHHPAENCSGLQKPKGLPAAAATDKHGPNNLFWGGFNYASWERNTERGRNIPTPGKMWGLDNSVPKKKRHRELEHDVCC